MSHRLKSKTGCLTCLVRKKKCDEQKPRCGHCQRLELACVPRDEVSRGSKSLPRITRLRAKESPQRAISNGHPPFRSDFEKHISRGSPWIFSNMISRGGGPAFFNIDLLGRFCTQSRVVREAVAAFSAFTFGVPEDSYKAALTNYQSCIVRLRHLKTHELQDTTDKDLIITTLVFLGIVEALNLGDPQVCIAHLKMCKRLLADRLAKPGMAVDPDLLAIFRIAAECIVFNLGTLTPFLPDVGWVYEDQDDNFDSLFPADDASTSPFLGGLHEVYSIMLKLNILSQQIHASRSSQSDHYSQMASCHDIWSRLDQLDRKIPLLYPEHLDGDQDTNALYRTKHQMFICALRVHLIKVSRPDAHPSDDDIRFHVQQAIAIFRQQDLREPPNPSIRWPMTIIACAIDTDDDFAFLTAKMLEISLTIGTANQEKLELAFETLHRFRTIGDPAIPSSLGSVPVITNSLDYLLQPWRLLPTAETTQIGSEPDFGVDISDRVTELE